jgi:hypothetical protein
MLTLHQQRYRTAAPAPDLADKRIRYYEHLAV